MIKCVGKRRTEFIRETYDQMYSGNATLIANNVRSYVLRQTYDEMCRET
jgi:hypothetical protein